MRAAGAGIDQAAHLGEQPHAFVRFHQNVIGRRAHHRDVFIRREFLRPYAARNANALEQSALFDLLARIRDGPCSLFHCFVPWLLRAKGIDPAICGRLV
jgi:hypothetical protein